jgi:hypothetical protein
VLQVASEGERRAAPGPRRGRGIGGAALLAGLLLLVVLAVLAVRHHRNAAPAPGGELFWAPPSLTDPTTVTIDSDAIRRRGPDGHKWFLDDRRDYVIRIGRVTTPYGVVIAGGHDVVVLGGRISIPWAGTYASPQAAYRDMPRRRALLVAGQTGTVHVEGLRIDDGLGDLSEGVQIQAPGADVQIENVRITGVHARDEVGFSDNHPDCVQPLGVQVLRIDRLTCSVDAHYSYMSNDDGPIGRIDLRRVNVHGTRRSYPRLFHRRMVGRPFPMTLHDVWIAPAQGERLLDAVTDQLVVGGIRRGFAPRLADDGSSVSWPGDPFLSGSIRAGVPPGGDFVPASAVGLGYRSPGYRSPAPLAD